MPVIKHKRDREETETAFLEKYKAFKDEYKLTNGRVAKLMRAKYDRTPTTETIARWENEKIKTPMGWDLTGHIEKFMRQYEQENGKQ